jgi:putative tryptophan/tyrosine transport system substrate-binding protein
MRTGANMRRREFIKIVGGTAATWPLRAGAQQPSMPVVGFLRSTSLADAAHLITAFRQGLQEAGFVEGRNVIVEYRSAEAQRDRLASLVASFIRRPVSAIVCNAQAAHAVKVTTATVPIVFVTGTDPVRDGLVDSLNRPGGNLTGVTFFAGLLSAKRLELLRLLVPKAASVAILMDPSGPDAEAVRRDAQAAAQAMGLQFISLEVRSDLEIEKAFATLVERGTEALQFGSGAFFNSHRERIVALAARYRMPSIYNWREAATAGGLMSYAASITDAYRQAGRYAGSILKGEKPGDLPVVQPTKFEFVINLQTAKALGLEIPDRLLALADEVIE